MLMVMMVIAVAVVVFLQMLMVEVTLGIAMATMTSLRQSQLLIPSRPPNINRTIDEGSRRENQNPLPKKVTMMIMIIHAALSYFYHPSLSSHLLLYFLPSPLLPLPFPLLPLPACRRVVGSFGCRETTDGDTSHPQRQRTPSH